MINLALTNLEKGLAESKLKMQQKETALASSNTKINNLNNEIKVDEDSLRVKKTEIIRLEQDIRSKGMEVKKEIELHKHIEGEIHILKQKQDNDHLQLVRITREEEDRKRKEEQTKKTHSSHSL